MDFWTILGLFGVAFAFIGFPLSDLIDGWLEERRSKKARDKIR